MKPTNLVNLLYTLIFAGAYFCYPQIMKNRSFCTEGKKTRGQKRLGDKERISLSYQDSLDQSEY